MDSVAAVDWTAYESEATAAIAAAAGEPVLDDARVKYLGRKSELAQALRGVRDRESGILLNGIRERLEAAVTERGDRLRREELDRRLRDEIVDVTLPGEQLPLGHLHPITQVRRDRRGRVPRAWLRGARRPRGRDVEYNFDKLAFAPTHSSRSPRDTFFFDPNHVLRTETSPSQIHILEEKQPPIYMVSIGRVYRRDAITATHYPISTSSRGSRSTAD